MIRFLEWLLAKLRGERTYIVLKEIFPAPIDLGTAWVAYEAAPQQAKNARSAMAQFVADSGEHGIFFAVPREEFFAEYQSLAPGYLKDIV